MTPEEEKRFQRMEELAEMIRKFRTTDPVLTDEDLAIIFSEELTDISSFLKEYKKQLKKNGL